MSSKLLFFMPNFDEEPSDSELLAIEGEEVLSTDPAVIEMETEMALFAINVARPKDKVGDYVVTQESAEGGSAKVFSAVNPHTGKEVVLRTPALTEFNFANLPIIQEQFRQEHRLLQILGECPHVVESLGHVKHRGVSYHVVEQLPLSIDEAVIHVRRGAKKYGRVRAFLNIADSLAKALMCMEELGIVNGDVSRHNLRAVQQGQYVVCKLIDFTGAYDAQKFHTVSRRIKACRPNYKAPEAEELFRESQRQGKFLLAPSMDMYGAGITLREIGKDWIDDPAPVLSNIVHHMTRTDSANRIRPADLLSEVRGAAWMYGIRFQEKIHSADLSVTRKQPTHYQS